VALVPASLASFESAAPVGVPISESVADDVARSAAVFAHQLFVAAFSDVPAPASALVFAFAALVLHTSSLAVAGTSDHA